MSDVDKKVVQIDFDNKKFEKNVRQSRESLGELKKSLNFDGVSKSIDQVTVKISALEIATTTFIVNLTNRITNLGIQMVKSLSVDNISAGWTKYGQKTTAIATMMAQSFKIAGKELTDQSEKMAAVTEQLERLSWFSDETSYTFTDMVDNVGKFIAAGQDLDVSVKAMEGIATWAALSGQNATTASRAMYQLSQAMGKGKIQLIDYKSIQNANMDTVEFRQTILETAVSLGQLTKEGDKFVTKTGKKFSQSQFAEELSSGWFTSEVLVKGLEKYSSAVEEIYALAEKEGKTATEIIEEYGDTLDSFGLKAFKAAQEARTFADVLSSVKDAVSSKWMTTSELIFGDKDQAIELWTSLSNALYEVFAEGGNFRNEILKVWNSLGGREDLFKRGGKDQGAFWNIYDAIIAVKDLIRSAWNTVFPLSQMEDESDQAQEIGNSIKTLTKRFQLFTKNLQMSSETSMRLKKIFEGIFSVLKFGLQVIQALRYILDPIFELGKKIITFVLDKIVALINSVNISTNTLFKIAEKIGNTLNNLFSSLKSGLHILEPIKKLIVGVGNFLSKIFKGVFKAGVTILDSFYTLIKNISNVLSDLFKDVFKTGVNILESFKKLLSNIGRSFSNLINSIKDSSKLQSFTEMFSNFIKKIVSGFKALEPLLKNIIKIFKEFIKMLLSIPRMINGAVKSLTGRDIVENIKWIFDSISNLLQKFKNKIDSISGGKVSNVVEGVLSPISELFSGLVQFFKGLLAFTKVIIVTLGKVLNTIGSILEYIADVLLDLYDGKKKLEWWQTTLIVIAGIIAGIAIIFSTIYSLVYSILAVINPLRVLVDSLTGLIDKISMRLVVNSFVSISDSLVKITIALSLLSTIKSDRLLGSVAAVSLLAIVMTGIVFALIKISSAVTKAKTITSTTSGVLKNFVANTQNIGAQVGNFKNVIKQKENGLSGARSISIILSSFTTAMLKVAASLMIISKISWEDLGKGLIVMASLFVSAGLLAIIARKRSNDIKNAIPSVIQILSFSLLLKSFASTLTSVKDFSGKQMLNIIVMWVLLEVFLVSIAAIVTLIQTTSASIKDNEGKKLQSIAKILNSISGLLLSFGVTMKLLSSINLGTFVLDVLILGLFFTELAGLMFVIEKFGGNNLSASEKSISPIAKILNSISGLLLSFGVTMKLLSSISLGNLALMTLIIALLLAEIGNIVISIDKYGSKNADKLNDKNKTFLLSVSLFLLSFAFSVKKLASIEWTKLIAPTLAIAGVIIAFAFAIEIMSKSLSNGDKAKSAIMMMGGLIALILVFGYELKQFQKTTFSEYSTGVLGFAILLGSLMGTMAILAKSDIDLKKAGSMLMVMVGLAGLLLTFGYSMKMVAEVPWQTILSASLPLAVLLGSLIALTAMLSKSGSDGVDLLLKFTALSVGLIAMSASMILFAKAIQQLAMLDFMQVITSLVGLAGAIAIFAIGGKLLAPLSGQMLQVAAAILLVGMALVIVVTSLQMFINMITKVTGVTTEQLQASVTSIGAIAETIAEVVMNVLSVVLEKIKENIPLIFSVIQEFLTNSFDLIENVIGRVSEILDTILENLNEWVPQLIKLVGSVITNVLNYLDENIKDITEKVVNIFIKITDKLNEKMDEIVVSVVSFFKSLFSSLYRNSNLIHETTGLLLKLVLKIIKNLALDVIEVAGTIAEVLLIFLAAAIRIVIASLGGLAKLFLELISGLLMLFVHTFFGMANVLYEVFRTIFYNIAALLAKVVRNLPGDFWNTIKYTFQSLWSGILGVIYDITKNIPVVGDWIKSAYENSLSAVEDTQKEIESIARGDNVQEALKTAKENISNTVANTSKGVAETTKESIETIKSAIEDAKKDYEEVFNDLGSSVVDGYEKGIEENTDSAVDAASNMATKSSEAVAKANDSHSPSRVFEKLGLYTVLGYVKGVTENTHQAVDGMSLMAESALNAAQEVLNDQNGDDITLKVGLDISSVEGQAQRVSDIMTGINNIDASAYGRNAMYNARVVKETPEDKSPAKCESTSNVTYNNVFNISSTDPEESADEIDKALSRQAMRAKLAHGNI